MFFFLSFSLLVHDNMNLQELFPENVQNNLEILNGNMFFHYNRKLCYNKIKSFESKVKMDNKSKNDISDSSNGDQMPCKNYLIHLLCKKSMDSINSEEFDVQIICW